jgi:hypothetical protein
MGLTSASKVAVICSLAGVIAGAAAMKAFGTSAQPHPRLLAPQVEEHFREPQPPVELVVRPTTATLGEDEKRALRALVRDELRAALASGAMADAGQPASSPTDALASLSPNGMKTYDKAKDIIDTAIRHGSWTSEDRDQLREKLSTLPPDVYLEVVSPLVAAVNRREVRFEGRGPLF